MRPHGAALRVPLGLLSTEVRRGRTGITMTNNPAPASQYRTAVQGRHWHHWHRRHNEITSRGHPATVQCFSCVLTSRGKFLLGVIVKRPKDFLQTRQAQLGGRRWGRPGLPRPGLPRPGRCGAATLRCGRKQMPAVSEAGGTAAPH